MENKKVYNKSILVRLTEEEHRAWRKLSYLSEVPMCRMIKECIEARLKETKKILTNADIKI